MIEIITHKHYRANIFGENIRKYLYYSVYYFIIIVLLFSGITKILDPLPLIKTLEAFKLFSDTINIFISTTLPILEIGLALLLILKKNQKIILSVTLFLFTGFLFYSIYGYYLGIVNDCGCFGNLIKSEFGVSMIVRNFFLFMVIGYLVVSNNKNIL